MKLALFVLPLGLDTFAVAAALGIAGLPRRRRLQLGLVMAGFELAMPVVGLLVGHGVGHVLGGVAKDVAAGLLFALAAWMLLHGEEEDVARDVHGLALIGLGLSVSLDELAIGFSFGLTHVSVVAALVLIAVQAFVASQLGLRFGARLREHAERLAAVALVALAIVLLL